MSEREHSDSEFYYPDEQEIVTTGGGDDKNENNNNNSQEEIENFLKEQKSANTARKTTCDLKTLKTKKCHIINNLLTSTIWSCREISNFGFGV